ncbi:GNAT family N-acetyltransferase [Mesorhizobium sp. CA14]|uniref:GNAT family N-acetyltransferase n=1 Tax=Mesorhizobium sp. CA14 TaxID=2876642 RepID=UPI002961F417|nr:GNAT family N-acetyltransferase [Mesorhizobium sp. CA14]
MADPSKILYASEPALDVAEFRRVLVESGLGETRPVDDEARLKTMLGNANLVLTARLDIEGKPLIGVARGITDFSWVCYISELAVSASAQGLGVGKGLRRGAAAARAFGRHQPDLDARRRRLLRAHRHGAHDRRLLVFPPALT